MKSGVLSALLALLAVLVLPTTANAQDPPALRVTAIPWVATNPAIPHVTLNGVVTTLKAVAEGGACGGQYRYRWDMNGDGDFEDPGEQERNASAGGQFGGFFAPLEGTTTFPDSAGDRVWLPRVRAWCGEEQATAVHPVLQRVDRICGWGGDRGNGRQGYQCQGDQSVRLTRSALTDRAIDDGLWYLFKAFSHGADDIDGQPVRYCHIAGVSYPWFQSGQALLAAMRRGHNYNDSRDDNPYYRHFTQCGLHYILRSMARGAVSDRGGHTANVDEDGYGLHVSSAGHGYSSYQAGSIYEPLAFFGNPDYEAPLGIAEVRGHTLRDIGQDGADWLVYAMSDYGGAGNCDDFPLAGGRVWGWEYNPHATQHVDNSTNGWPGEALRILQRKFGTETYEFAKDRQRCFLRHYCGDAGCYYSGWRAQLSGNGLTSAGWTYDETFDAARPEMAGPLNRITASFDGWYGSCYNMYATTKGLRAFSPEITQLPDGRDWHSDFVDWLLPRQEASGRWTTDNSHIISYSGNWATTAQYVQIMQTWLEAFAYARAEPQLVAPGFPIQLRHDWSYILDPEVDIRTFRWSVQDDPDVEDLNEDGVISLDEVTWEYETDDPDEIIEHVYDIDIGFDELRNYRVVLQVEDSQGRVNYDQDRVQVQVSKVNHAPVAVVTYPEGHEWYRGHSGTTLTLDVSGSFDPDAEQAPFPGDEPEDCDEEGEEPCRPEGVADQVTRIEWDLDFDGEFDDAEGPTVDFEIPDGVFEDGERFAVRVRICDDGQWNGQCYDQVDEEGDPLLDEDGEPVQDCSVCTEADVIIELVGFTPPEISLEGLPELPTDQGVTITLDASGSFDPDDVGGLVFLWDLDGDGEYDDAEGAVLEWVIHYAPGTHEIGLSLTDAGEQTTTTRHEFEVVNVPPTLDEFAPVGEGFEQGAAIEVSVSASDPGADPLQTSVTYVGPAGGEAMAADWMDDKWWVPTTAPGTYTVRGATSDAHGGSDDAEFTVEVANLAPEMTRVFAAGPVSEGQPIMFRAWAKDAGGDPLTWSFDVGADGTKEADGLTDPVFAYKPTASGSYQVEVTATDDGGLLSTMRQSFTVENVEPVILSVFDNGPVGAGEALQIFVNAYDASPIDSLLLQFGFDVGGDGELEANGPSPTFSHVFTDPGTHTVVVTVSDGEDTARFEHEVDIGARELLSPELVVEGEGNLIHFTVDQLVQDAPADGEYSWSLGDESTAEGAAVSHAYADEGNYVVEVSSGGVVLGRATAVITNQPPVFRSLPSAALTAGELWEYVPTVTDPGVNDKVTLSVEEGPEGMAVAETTDGDVARVAIQWTPAKADDGEHRVKIKAEDEDGGVSWQEFNLFLNLAAEEQEAFEASSVASGCATASPASGGGDAWTAALLLLGLLALGRARR